MKWDCRGIKEQISNIKKADKGFKAYRALKLLDTTISSLMADNDNDMNMFFVWFIHRFDLSRAARET